MVDRLEQSLALEVTTQVCDAKRSLGDAKSLAR
jgi:hypothetical protein